MGAVGRVAGLLAVPVATRTTPSSFSMSTSAIRHRISRGVAWLMARSILPSPQAGSVIMKECANAPGTSIALGLKRFIRGLHSGEEIDEPTDWLDLP